MAFPYSRQSANEAESETDLRRDEVERTFLRIARLRLNEQQNRCRPSVILRPQLSAYVNPSQELTYVASYGALFCNGSTPDEAYEQFDRAWVEGI
jgi:hypothetical protein